MTKTKIEWSDVVWNPIRGCTRVSRGCERCYAERQAARFAGPGQPWHGFVEHKAGGPRWTGKVELIDEKLAEPLSWRKPRRVFVNSMSDLFEESLHEEAIDQVFAIMALAPQHTFQILTKRPERMRAYMESLIRDEEENDGERLWVHLRAYVDDWPDYSVWSVREGRGGLPFELPLPHVMLGTSIEDQASADERIPHLLATPAAKRFVSYEPALGPVDFRPEWLKPSTRHHLRLDIEGALHNRSFVGFTDPETGRELSRDEAEAALRQELRAGKRFLLVGDSCDGFSDEVGCPGHRTPALDWVIVGGESGPEARPCNVAWIRAIVEQCQAAGVKCFVKQLGAKPVGQPWRKARGKWVEMHAHPARQGELVLNDPKGGDPAEWPADLRVREVLA